MRLASKRNGTRDGELIVVSPDAERCLSAAPAAPTLQAALDGWSDCSPKLEELNEQLRAGRGSQLKFEELLAPLPRAYEWIDGSCYINHIKLVRRARGAQPPAGLETDPLVYQGGSSLLLAAHENFVLPDADWGLDFEGEVCVVLDDTPRGTTSATALDHVRLIMLANDWTYRNLVSNELAKGFGFFSSKPASAFSGFALTPDELGGAWKGGKLHLPLRVRINGRVVGTPNAATEMHFSFADLIGHICKTRGFGAGTLLGSGTVSETQSAAGYACLAEQRAREIIESGQPKTPFLGPGDRVQIDVLDHAERDLFGSIDQLVVAGENA